MFSMASKRRSGCLPYAVANQRLTYSTCVRILANQVQSMLAPSDGTFKLHRRSTIVRYLVQLQGGSWNSDEPHQHCQQQGRRGVPMTAYVVHTVSCGCSRTHSMCNAQQDSSVADGPTSLHALLEESASCDHLATSPSSSARPELCSHASPRHNPSKPATSPGGMSRIAGSWKAMWKGQLCSDHMLGLQGQGPEPPAANCLR